MTGRGAGEAREEGRIMLLTAGMVAVALMIVAMVASATAVHLDRKQLYDLADAVAADAADAMPPERFYAGEARAPDGTAVLTLTDADVERSALDYLAAHPEGAAGLDGLRLVEASSPDGRTARVGVQATSHPPLVRWFTDAFGGGFTVAATSSARAG
ncbi:hypothetical protein [Isoptericola cucumis]|uniref:Flp pilus-assembly TadG-like N-terminal domain-containing protein n=1 Tax=Isoptericola cucumis TaxID=1776856 RepID=A0ABQ2B5T2_9MICO|nr:hypothetical protein [Isoptericola cucumis]GGI08549.1 hypothetical protein GCM10007368_21730 [Isoptericola cucumis]